MTVFHKAVQQDTHSQLSDPVNVLCIGQEIRIRDHPAKVYHHVLRIQGKAKAGCTGNGIDHHIRSNGGLIHHRGLAVCHRYRCSLFRQQWSQTSDRMTTAYDGDVLSADQIVPQEQSQDG